MVREQWDSYETRVLRVGSRISFFLSVLGTIGMGIAHSKLYRRYENGEDVFGDIPLDAAAVVFPILAIALQLLSSKLSRQERSIRSSVRRNY
jgi:hypothetical protein